MLDHPSRTQRTLLDRIDATDATLSEPSRGRLQRRQAVGQGCGQIERPAHSGFEVDEDDHTLREKRPPRSWH
jgi:hypothetical protein